MPSADLSLPIQTPPIAPAEYFTDAKAAVERLIELYDEACGFLTEAFSHAAQVTEQPEVRWRAFYPVSYTRRATRRPTAGCPSAMCRGRGITRRPSRGQTCFATTSNSRSDF